MQKTCRMSIIWLKLEVRSLNRIIVKKCFNVKKLVKSNKKRNEKNFKKMRVYFAQDTVMFLDILSQKWKCIAGAPDIFELFEMQQVAGKYGGGYNSDALCQQCQPMPRVPAFFDLAWRGKQCSDIGFSLMRSKFNISEVLTFKKRRLRSTWRYECFEAFFD